MRWRVVLRHEFVGSTSRICGGDGGFFGWEVMGFDGSGRAVFAVGFRCFVCAAAAGVLGVGSA